MNLYHAKSPLINFVALFTPLLETTCQVLGIYEFFPADFLTKGAFRLICGTIPALCKFGASLIADEDPSLDKTDRFTDYMGHFPSGTSLRCLIHYAQIMNSGDFKRFDFGSSENKKHYG